MSFDELLNRTTPAFRQLFGQDVPVLMSGILVRTIRAHVDHELISEAPNQAEIGTPIMTLVMAKADYESLDAGVAYVFVVDGESKKRRGPPLMDGTGDVKIFLTKA